MTEQKQVERLKAQTRRPSTPGDLAAMLAENLGLTQGQLAARLGVGRQSVNELVKGRRRLTADMAQRLGRLFGNGPELWLQMQTQRDLWDVSHMDIAPYASIEPLPMPQREHIAA